MARSLASARPALFRPPSWPTLGSCAPPWRAVREVNKVSGPGGLPLVLCLVPRDPAGEPGASDRLAPLRSRWRLLEAGVSDGGSRGRGEPGPGLVRVGPAGPGELVRLLARGLTVDLPGASTLALVAAIALPLLLAVGILAIGLEGLVGRRGTGRDGARLLRHLPLVGMLFRAERSLRVSASLLAGLDEDPLPDLILARGWEVLPAACLLATRWKVPLVYLEQGQGFPKGWIEAVAQGLGPVVGPADADAGLVEDLLLAASGGGPA